MTTFDAASPDRDGSEAAKPKTRTEEAFRTLRQQILSGELPPGSRLPIQETADALGMSPMPVREAMRELDAAGLVDNVPHRGATVTRISIGDLREVYDLRLALETLAVRRAAERFSDEDAIAGHRALRELNARAHEEQSVRLAWHTAFHFALYEASGSVRLPRLIRPLWEASGRYRFAAPLSGRLEMREGEHEAILDACVAHEPDRAHALLHNHLGRAVNALAETMGAPPLFALAAVPRRRGRQLVDPDLVS
ncbi:GntR family transcriptional regulator [Conexibacter woesei]|uniref:Transcriptional regulator, GntR family n=1 Tax=Conexibacter woesei (strain DSM 14684 / CCUG 47730 / CIP 108061 / JCM 11494 / NBRC 100937 / ID131577) TaxID=469383 RepID=D3F477_CONWI|nr:GntR family transcriptional regulator [Conexibacter woesei]ADB50449.1 transcriptional regulator, GntR family [Conexibacter woesei DSM 14684]